MASLGLRSAFRIRDILSAKDPAYGAKGDNVTSDTVAVQAAANDAAANSRALWFPKGTYLIDAQIGYAWANTAGSLHLMGETIGRGFSGSFLKWTGVAGGTLWKSTGTNSLLVEHLGFDGNQLADKLFWCESGVASSDMQFINCKFSNGRRTTKSVGLQIGSGTVQVSEVTVDRCLFQTLYYGMLSFTANVKNFKVLNSGASLCFWGLAHGNPDSAVSLSGQFLVSGTVFLANGNTPGGFFNGVAGAVSVGGDLFCADGTIQSCESEGSARFVYGGNAGNNPSHLTLIGNDFEDTNAVPADDYVVIAGGSISLINNRFMNGRTGASVAKVQVIGLASIYAAPLTTYTTSCISLGNWYENASQDTPIYDGSNNLITLSTSLSGISRSPVASFGDRGGTPGALLPLKAVLMDGMSGVGRLVAQNGTTSSYPYDGLLSVGVNKVTVSYTELIAAATVHRRNVWDIPARTKVTNIVVDTTTPFAGLAGTIQLTVGDGSVENGYILAHDIKTAVITKGIADADLGAYVVNATAVQGGKYYWVAGSVIRLKFDSSVGNFGNGAVTNLSAGSVDCYVTVERMP